MSANQPSPYTVRLSQSDLDLLKELAREKNVSHHSLARTGIKNYLQLLSDRSAT